MKGLQELLLKEEARLQEIVQIVKERLKGAPEGKLRISKSHGYPQYYRCMGEKKGGQYIAKEKEELIQRLAQKSTMATRLALYYWVFTTPYKIFSMVVFQMFTGLCYSDAQAFNIRNYKLVDGRWRYNGKRIKTGVPYVSELLPPVIDVLERNGWKVPKIENGFYNKILKVLGMAAGIQTRFHSHLARHSFATKMMASHVEIQNISRMLGHKNITQTQRYAKVHPEDVFAEFTRVEQMSNKYKQETK